MFTSEQPITYLFYENSFNPAFKYANLIGTNQYDPFTLTKEIQIMLNTTVKYILLLTISHAYKEYQMLTTATGPDVIHFTPIKISGTRR